MGYVLEQEGIEVAGAPDGEKGLEILEQLRAEGKEPDLIITDINMPRLDGFSFLRQVKSHDDLRFVPVLVLTTESGEDFKQKGKDNGAAGWLVKPFAPEQLVEVVRKFLKP